MVGTTIPAPFRSLMMALITIIPLPQDMIFWSIIFNEVEKTERDIRYVNLTLSGGEWAGRLNENISHGSSEQSLWKTLKTAVKGVLHLPKRGLHLPKVGLPQYRCHNFSLAGSSHEV